MFQLLKLNNPFFGDLQRAFENAAHEALDVVDNTLDTIAANWAPATNVYENETALTIRYEVPGIPRENITIEVREGNVLHITGKKEVVTNETSGKLIRSESFSGSFTRNIPLSKKIDAENITASLENGILTVNVPKTAPAPAKTISIN